jgi:hypothetical protein
MGYPRVPISSEARVSYPTLGLFVCVVVGSKGKNANDAFFICNGKDGTPRVATMAQRIGPCIGELA